MWVDDLASEDDRAAMLVRESGIARPLVDAALRYRTRIRAAGSPT
jgi:hypothetical protein